MYACTDKDKVDAIFVAKTPRTVEEIMLELCPDATRDANGRYHAPCDGYVCSFIDKVYRGGEYLPFDDAGNIGGTVWTVQASYNDNVVTWEGSPAQIVAVRSELQRQTRDLDIATSNHLGSVGDKVLLQLEICFIKTLFGYYGYAYLHIMRDAKGNIVVYKGTKMLWAGEQERAKGQHITLTAKVKAHITRDDVQQTIIERPKVLCK